MMSSTPTSNAKLNLAHRKARTARWFAVSAAALVVAGALFLLVVRGDAIVVDLASGWAAIAACF